MKIDRTLHTLLPNLQILSLEANVEIKKTDIKLHNLVKEIYYEIKNQYETNEIAEIPAIKHIRKAYTATGKSPSRYRNSAEALMRRATQGKEIYDVNTLVDINNYLSLKHHIPIGSYDLKQIQGETLCMIAPKGSTYHGIGKEVINIENMIVLADEIGPYGSATSDSVRCMIHEETQKIRMCFYVFDSHDYDLHAITKDAIALLEEYTNAYDIRILMPS